MSSKITFSILDDHQLFAEGLSRILMEEDDFELLKVYNSIDQIGTIEAQLLLLDIQLAGENGMDLCKRLKKEMPELKVILISMIQAPHLIRLGKAYGADGFIPKTTDAAILKDTVKSINQGQKIFLGQESDNHKINLLSEREMQIIHLIKKGMKTRGIAEHLFISEFTVETHRKNILRKLQLSSPNELLAYAYENHL